MATYVSYAFAQVLTMIFSVRSCRGRTPETQQHVMQSLTDPEMRKEFTLPLVDGAWPMGPDQKGAYIVANEERMKIIHETQFVDTPVIDDATNETTVEQEINVVRVARLDP